MDISHIHFHDSQIQRVIEDPEQDDLLFEVSYLVDWENNRFEPRVIAFRDMLEYEIHEGPCWGKPTILDVHELSHDEERVLVRIETNFGYRQLRCTRVDLLEMQ